MSAIIGTDPYKCYFNQGSKRCKGPTSNVQGGITASMAGGSWVAALISGYISDIMGRKKAIMVGAVIWYVFLPMLKLNSSAGINNEYSREILG
jgi:MFS family permease